MKLKFNAYNFVSALLIVLVFSSCGSRKDIVYFQDEPIANAVENMNSNYEIRYQSNDMLTIDVSSLDPAAARPYNLPAVSYNATDVISAQGGLKMQTYLIDNDGFIDFPQLGKIKLGGLTRTEAHTLMKEKLVEYLKDPIVNIRLANFTITVLGEVNQPGAFTIADERVSLNEALGLAGDLTIYGKRDNIFLIREVNGEKRYAKFDLSSINVVNSPNYYLAQNDVIYVEPNNARVRQSTFNQNNTVIISAIATLATIAAILIR